MSSSTKTSRQLQAEQTKLEIYNAAMRLLKKQDFNSITVRDIVHEANVSIGSFYHAYQTKLEVFYETYQIADNYFESVVRSMLIQETMQERILYFFREYATYNIEMNPFALTKVLYNSNNSYFHRNSDYGMLRILKDLIQQAKDSGEFSTHYTAGEIARFLMICIRGVVYDWCTCDGNYDLKDKIEQYATLLLRAYY